MKRVLAITAVSLLLAGCGSDDGGGGAPPAPTSTPSEVATPVDTPTSTRTPTPTGTATPTLGFGANIGYFGILRADNTVVDPIAVDGQGRPVFERPTGSGFVIVVEAQIGSNNRPVGDRAVGDGGPPDLQIQASRDLGNGSPDVCDTEPGHHGGVPGIDPPDFTYTPEIVDALNDFGCRFIDGGGQPVGRPRSEACVMFPDGDFGFVNDDDTLQFCGTVTLPMRLAQGDTTFTARVLDDAGNPGPERQIVVRVPGP